MKIHHAAQGTEDWLNARLALPTASQFHRIVTPSKLELSAQRWGYANKLLAEWLAGMSMDDEAASAAMQRGTDLEPKARLWYEIARGVDVQEVGLCMTDDEAIGCSPDGLVGEDGGLEIKVPLMPQTVSYWLGRDKVEEEHRLQIQGALWVTRRKWWDAVVYNPLLGGIITRVEPDEKVQRALDHALPIFIDELNNAKDHLLSKGCVPFMVREADEVPM